MIVDSRSRDPRPDASVDGRDSKETPPPYTFNPSFPPPPRRGVNGSSGSGGAAATVSSFSSGFLSSAGTTYTTSAPTSGHYTTASHALVKPSGREYGASAFGAVQVGGKQLPDLPSASVNQPHLQNGNMPIAGTFYIDPKIPSLGFDAKGFKSRKKNPPHASFRTRSGAISLDLGTTGDVRETPKASVLVGSRTGNINIKLLPSHAPSPRMGLEVVSRRGNIVLYLPRDYTGAVQLKTRKGSLNILPGLASVMRVMKEADDEALIFVGDPNVSGPATDTRAVDFCQLSSSRGKVVVGFTGMDKFEQKTGFWRTLGRLLRHSRSASD